MGRDGEIGGLAEGSGCRSCKSHENCGGHLDVGDLVKFKVCVTEVGQEEETLIKAVNIRDRV
jgi:hypothetical protein